MDQNKVLIKVLELAARQFGVDAGSLDEASSASQFPSWNSLNHVMLIAAVEKEFGIKFDLLQMVDMKNLGEIANSAFNALK